MSLPLCWQLHSIDPQQGLGVHRAAWDRLNRAQTAGHAMLDGGFIDALLRHFGAGGVQLAVAHDGQAPVAMLLINLRARGLGVWSSFMPSQTQVGPSLVPTDTDLSGLMAALPGYAGELDLLCNDPRFGDLRALPGQPVQSLPHALTMSVSLRNGFDDYWAQRPRKLIQNMRRYLRRLQSEPGGERLDIISAPEAIATAVDRYAVLESSGWKGREGTAIGNDNSQGRFYAELMQTFAQRGEALIYELWLGEELLASRMLLLRDGMAVMLKTAFHERFERLAPGRILLLRTLEDLFKRAPGGIVEFYTNAEADLLAWSTSQRWINHVSVYRHNGLAVLYGLLRRSTRGWLRRGKQPVDTAIMVSRSGASVETYAHVRELPVDAIALLHRAEEHHVEFGADWLANLIDTVYAREPRLHEVRILVLRRQGRVLAVVPTVAQTGTLGREVSALSNFYTAIYAPALDDDLEAEDLLPLTRALRQGGADAAAYRFSPMDPDSREFALLKRALTLAGLSTHAYFSFGNWYEPVRQHWPDYLKDRSGQLRSTIKRMNKKFASEGGRLEVVRDGDALEVALAAYRDVYARSWKVPEPYPDFVPGLIRLCARRGWLRLGIAWLHDKPVAVQFWIIANGRANIYKLAYDQAHKALAPGTLLTALLMEQALDLESVQEVDYLIGDAPYKAEWMSRRRERLGLVAYDPLTLHGLVGLVRQTAGNAWRRLRTLRNTPHPADNPAS
ncbi:GNAT family N-acetyltransferase [Roseateles saccharophilus]|uniref:GNAT family N-acetyltransferase n=1 Tax=Roseateles saccharophilus TaxID=304 RepID=UPI00140457BF|nr:GNAT family N-acetyltransferase [Roseateles saccharophilus]